MVGNVAYPIDRPSNGRLITKRMRSGVDHHVSHDTNVVHASVDLESIVMKVRRVIVVVVDGDGPPVPILFEWIVRTIDRVRPVWVSIGLDIDSVVEIRNIVVG